MVEGSGARQRRGLLTQVDLIRQMTRRQIVGRYRGSLLGVLWSLVVPIFMLSVYTLVFGTVMRPRWRRADVLSTDNSMGEFAIFLFAGLIVFQIFAEVLNRSPSLIVSNRNFVKKIVFPLEILPVVTIGAALFQASVSLMVLVGFIVIVFGHVPLTGLLLPIIWAPFLLLLLGLSWFVAALGVYVRDIAHIISSLITALMFLSPIFFSASALPASVRPYLFVNPITFPVEETRNVLLWGLWPNWLGLALYAVVAMAIAALGRLWFEKMRGGFADVL